MLASPLLTKSQLLLSWRLALSLFDKSSIRSLSDETASSSPRSSAISSSSSATEGRANSAESHGGALMLFGWLRGSDKLSADSLLFSILRSSTRWFSSRKFCLSSSISSTLRSPLQCLFRPSPRKKSTYSRHWKSCRSKAPIDRHTLQFPSHFDKRSSTCAPGYPFAPVSSIAWLSFCDARFSSSVRIIVTMAFKRKFSARRELNSSPSRLVDESCGTRASES
mmetsp:Transcript_36257/g.108722  ORF Transcript_36257/g.108722 Transcript_36257/m.108722 type:complete len:223 (-) Transcript_36257:1743-2411(-)